MSRALLILRPFRCFTSPQIMHQPFSSISNPSRTSQLSLQHFRSFNNVTAHFPNLQSLHLRHSSFSNPFVVSPTSPHSPTLSSLHLRNSSFSLHLRHRHFTYVTWRAAQERPWATLYNHIFVYSCRSLIKLSSPCYLLRPYCFPLFTFVSLRPPLWSRCNIVASHAAVPGSIPGRIIFLVEVLSGVFPQH